MAQIQIVDFAADLPTEYREQHNTRTIQGLTLAIADLQVRLAAADDHNAILQRKLASALERIAELIAELDPPDDPED